MTLVSTVYVLAERSPWKEPAGKFWRCALAILLVAPIFPLAAIYSRMMAPTTSVGPLPPSQPYEAVLRSALRIRDLESQNAPRASFLSAFWELDQVMPVAGPPSVRNDWRQLRRR